MKIIKRCNWSVKDELYIKYHDEEWGVPLFDDQKLFEFLTLESFQAGLSWWTILKKRENFREAFANFDMVKVAAFDTVKVDELMQDKGIVRYRKKIEAAINNAQCFLKVQKEYGSFSTYIWGFVNHTPIQNAFKTTADLPAKTPLSDKIAKDLKAKGFTFLGSTTVYAHMQATGMVNDHVESCFRYKTV